MPPLQFPKLKVFEASNYYFNKKLFNFILESSGSNLTTLLLRKVKTEMKIETELTNLKVLEIKQCDKLLSRSVLECSRNWSLNTQFSVVIGFMKAKG